MTYLDKEEETGTNSPLGC